MDLWMLHESRNAEREQAQRERRMQCSRTDRQCWKRRIALRCGLLLLRTGRRLIAYGRPSGSSAPVF